SRASTAVVCSGFALVDLLFLGANVSKIPAGGWFPLVIGGAIYLLMSTWERGRALLAANTGDGRLTVDAFLRSLGESKGTRVPGTAIYLHRHRGQVPPALLVNLERNRALHQQVVLVTVETARVSHVAIARRAAVQDLGSGFVEVILSFGFADIPDVPAALRSIVDPAFGLAEHDSTFVIAHEDVIPSTLPGMPLWRERLFAVMHRNAANAADQFHLPHDRVLQVGRRVEI
ncbi:MAG: KUP system potassium uptake protein, partial [Glaciecola sp.]